AISDLYSAYRIHTYINWVSGHTDVDGNETADQLAKTGTQLQSQLAITTCLAWLRRQAKSSRQQQWDRQWQTTRNGASYKGEPRLNLDAAIAPLRKFDSSIVVQLRTGHRYFNSYLATKSTARKKIPSTRYNCRAAQQTPEHFLLYCIKYKEDRRQLRIAVHPLPLTMEVLLHTPVGTRSLVDFIKATGVAKRPIILRWESERRRGEDWIEGD